LAQPADLIAQAGETVSRIVLGSADGETEPLVLAGAGGGDEIEACEHASGLQQRMNLPEQGLLALVLEMMDRKRRDHRVHRPLDRERLSEVVLAQFDQRVVGKA
jgi:hypothetical protein